MHINCILWNPSRLPDLVSGLFSCEAALPLESAGKAGTNTVLENMFFLPTFARYLSSSPEQGVHGLNVPLYWISMGTIYCIVKEALIE